MACGGDYAMKAAVERIDGGKATLAELRRAGIDALVPAFSAHVDRCARQVSVDQEAHAELGCWQRVNRLLFSQLTHKSERSPDVVGGDVVFSCTSSNLREAGEPCSKHREMRLMRVKTSGSHGRRRLKRIGTCSGGFQD
jgi:hypothetical protein